MKKIILATHGSLAEGMKSAVKMILNSDEAVRAYGLDTYEEPIHIYRIIEKEIAENQADTFIVITDINGGSVHNQMIQLCNYQNVYVQTGMCLSMVLEVILANEEEEMAAMMERIRQSTKENMLGLCRSTIVSQEEEELW